MQHFTATEEILSILLLLIALLGYIYFKVCFNYWHSRGVSSYPNPRIPLGHIGNPFKKSTSNMGVIIQAFYTYFIKEKQKHGGIYLLTSPIYMPVDLDIVKDIMVKYFDHFDSKGLYYNDKLQPISAHLFRIGGARWKKIRVKVSPTFTNGKMKMMFAMVMKCMQRLTQSINEEKTLDIKYIFGRFTMEVIASCAFGIECDSFEYSTFHYYASHVIQTKRFGVISQNIQLFIPKLAKALQLLPFPRDCEEYFLSIIADAVKLREDSHFTRNDFLQLLIETRHPENGNAAFSVQEIQAQAFLFFIAGFETTSTTLSFCLYELAKHSDIQERARKECLNVFEIHGGDLDYDALSELKYMQQVIEETLRLYPPVTILSRECTKKFQIDNVWIEKGTNVFIPCYAIHKDPHHYPNPDAFDPDRFSKEEKSRRHHFAYLPFGEGPRICIGMRFAFMQMKICLAYLLKEYKFTLDPSTKQQLSFNKRIVLDPNEHLLLKCEKIAKCD